MRADSHTLAACTALSLEQAHTGQSKQSMSAQAINQSIMHAHLVWKGEVVRERAVQAEGVGVSPHCSVAPLISSLRRHPDGVASLEGWSIGCEGWLPWEPAAGERPPRTPGLDVSLPFRHA